MTTDYGRFAPPADRRGAPSVRCARCQVLQPGRGQRCVACGAPLQRWVAHPPPGSPAAKPARSGRPKAPYAGPPSYRGGHPQWAFPPVIWRDLPDETPTVPVDDPSGALRWTAGLSTLAAAAALVAAGAEIWRFRLLLDGRTLVLDGATVRASDILVAASGLAVVTFALLAVAFAVPALVRTHYAAARRLGLAPSRSGPGIVARLLVPIWNVYGAGQIVTEIDRMVGAQSELDEGPRRASRITVAWWLSWVVSAVLIAITLARGLGGSLQAIADTVELHIAVDLVAAVVAALAALMFLRFARSFSTRSGRADRWIVQPPLPTRRPG